MIDDDLQIELDLTKVKLTRAKQHILILRQAIGNWDRAETSDELQQAEAGLLKALQLTKD